MLDTKQKMPLNILAKRLPELQDFPQQHKLSIYGVGCLLGEEDVLAKRPFTCNLRCYSTKGVVYEIKKEHFRMLMYSKESKAAIISSVKNKIAHTNAENIQKFHPPAVLPKASFNTSPKLDDFSVIDPEGFYKKKMKIRHEKSICSTLPEVASPAYLPPSYMNFVTSV